MNFYRPLSTPLPLRLDEEVLVELRKIALDETRSVASVIRMMIDDALARRQHMDVTEPWDQPEQPADA